MTARCHGDGINPEAAGPTLKFTGGAETRLTAMSDGRKSAEVQGGVKVGKVLGASLPRHRPPAAFPFRRERTEPRRLSAGQTGGSPPLCDLCGRRLPTCSLGVEGEGEDVRTSGGGYCGECCGLPGELLSLLQRLEELLWGAAPGGVSTLPHAAHGGEERRVEARDRAALRQRARALRRKRAATAQCEGQRLSFVSHSNTISYQLSGQRFVDMGWTLSPPASGDGETNGETAGHRHPGGRDAEEMAETQHGEGGEEGEEGGDEGGETASTDRQWMQAGLLLRCFPDGRPFLTLLPDGTGHLRHPSGRLAVLFAGRHRRGSGPSDGGGGVGGSRRRRRWGCCVVLADAERAGVGAVFNPGGTSVCLYPGGAPRFVLTVHGGSCHSEATGERTLRWLWDHGPGGSAGGGAVGRPLCAALCPGVGVRVVASHRVLLCYGAGGRVARFNVGHAPEETERGGGRGGGVSAEERAAVEALEGLAERAQAALEGLRTALAYPRSSGSSSAHRAPVEASR
ncbi:glutamate-rich protein 6-like isoform X2 [Petromyzon marinus]|uniref:glutamate-rich protein 6-like isoform X2 n=1 Tax=Petromyzon marinus TaxID=7757 RepID=UPI003F7249F0